MTVWRTGRQNGRTIYRQLGDEPSKADPMIGAMDTPELSRLVVDAVNARGGEGVTLSDVYLGRAGRENGGEPVDGAGC